jgi:hypothetical protein
MAMSFAHSSLTGIASANSWVNIIVHVNMLWRTDRALLFVAGRDQSAVDQPNNLADGQPPL